MSCLRDRLLSARRVAGAWTDSSAERSIRMSDSSTPRAPRTCRLTHEQRRKGGIAAAAKLTTEQRRLGGQRRRDQPSFRTLQQRRGRRGAQTTLQRYGIKVLVEKLAA